jgi:molybdopterin-guanine dinucleotide biosynthesis protein A
MGQDKASLALDGVTLLERSIQRLERVAEDILVVGRGQASAALAVRYLSDELPGRGPLAGMLTGLRAAQHSRCLVVACDLPFLNPDVLRYLLSRSPGYDAVVPCVGGRAQVLHAVYTRAAIPAIEQQLRDGVLQVERLLGRVTALWIDETEIAAIDPGLRSFANVNTPAEWLRALHNQQPQ